MKWASPAMLLTVPIFMDGGIVERGRLVNYLLILNRRVPAISGEVFDAIAWTAPIGAVIYGGLTL